jgi:hypothetical protein
MGVVDLARRDDGTLVALKRLALQGTPAEMRQATVRFQRELDVLARLDHDAVVPMLDVVEEAGDVVLVMPYLPGGNLAERVRDDGPMSADEVRALAQRLLPALAAAHRLGIIHRDIKPANVLFDADGRAHLADFGVARTREITGGLTRPGVVLGTPGYLAPEQARGEELTAAADIASLGATLHFAATGQSPYGTGEDHAVLLRTARAKARIDASIEPRLRRTIRSMLRAQPERRPTAAALAGGADGTRLMPALAQRRRPVVLAAAAVAVLVGAALAVGLAWGGGGDESEAATEPAAETTPTEPPCAPTKYQPCGEEPAPGTDGRTCLDGRDDYDGLTSNGCEAEADDLDGTELVDRIAANIVPADDVDRYPMEVADELDLGCNNTLRVEITAPPGLALRLEVLDGQGEVLGQATSADGIPGEVAIQDPRCFRNDSGTFVAQVTATGSDRTAEPYVLTRRGSF